MGKSIALTGNLACALAMRQIDPDVVPAYPITPQTTIVEEFANFVASGQVGTEYVNVESEHSAMSAAIGAAAAGARVMTATSSQGLAYMWEMLYIASALRLPIVMHNANRALSGPINIHCDHGDSMGARDSGWVQIFCENAQEAYDTTIQAVRIAEHSDVMLPVMVLLDGFIISHAIDRLEVLEDEPVKKFIGDYKPAQTLLDSSNPITVGPFDGIGGFYFEHRVNQQDAMINARKTIIDVGKEFKKISDRDYALLEEYETKDAEAVLIVAGSTAGTTRDVVRELREKGRKVGCVKLRSFRPFPSAEIVRALGAARAVGVLDRSMTPGAPGGPLYLETSTVLFEAGAEIPVKNFVYGLGGRDISRGDIAEAFNKTLRAADTGKAGTAVSYVNIRP